ncbi:hypothetical protein NDU88_004415 [Pleurodeles waltl]|uniref:Uncharacterized protein n=1 Tax=Pleurodeles waltl TaxID=8319 RepID=A0AAV7PFK8_PLEWA|nr:hypothetical protein NDU88_004415 [Pleurodeles waltl]
MTGKDGRPARERINYSLQPRPGKPGNGVLPGQQEREVSKDTSREGARQLQSPAGAREAGKWSPPQAARAGSFQRRIQQGSASITVSSRGQGSREMESSPGSKSRRFPKTRPARERVNYSLQPGPGKPGNGVLPGQQEQEVSKDA